MFSIHDIFCTQTPHRAVAATTCPAGTAPLGRAWRWNARSPPPTEIEGNRDSFPSGQQRPMLVKLSIAKAYVIIAETQSPAIAGIAKRKRSRSPGRFHAKSQSKPRSQRILKTLRTCSPLRETKPVNGYSKTQIVVDAHLVSQAGCQWERLRKGGDIFLRKTAENKDKWLKNNGNG